VVKTCRKAFQPGLLVPQNIANAGAAMGIRLVELWSAVRVRITVRVSDSRVRIRVRRQITQENTVLGLGLGLGHLPWSSKPETRYCRHYLLKLAATLRGSRPGVQSASLIMTSLMTS